MKTPLISIIIPVFNREGLIEETLDSVLAQSYTNWECIVVDDGSEDRTVEIVEEYCARDKRISLYKRPSDRNKGASPSRNYGLEKAKGDYIQFLDSDDLLHPSKFEEQLKILQNAPALGIATCKWGSFRDTSNLKVKYKYNSYRNFKNSLKLLYTFGKYEEYFPPIVYLVPRKVISKAGYWDESLINNPNDDGEYFTRVIMNSSSIIFCDTTEVYYRAGDESRLSLLDDEQKVRSLIESWKMIARHLETHKKIAEMYVGSGINSIYNRISDSYPEIIRENEVFFRGRKKAAQNWMDKILSSLKNIS